MPEYGYLQESSFAKHTKERNLFRETIMLDVTLFIPTTHVRNLSITGILK